MKYTWQWFFFTTVLNKLCLFYFIWFVEFLELKPIKIFDYLINGRCNDLLKQRLLRSTTLLLKCIIILWYFYICNWVYESLGPWLRGPAFYFGFCRKELSFSATLVVSYMSYMSYLDIKQLHVHNFNL